MMLQNATKILKVLDLLEQMPMIGQGATRPTIIYYSGVSHSSTYRYMGTLVKLGLVSVKLIENKTGILVAYYRITERGKGYVLDDKKLL